MSAPYVLDLNRHSAELLHEEDSSVLTEQSDQGLMLVGPTRCKHKCLHQLQQGVSSEEFALREELLSYTAREGGSGRGGGGGGGGAEWREGGSEGGGNKK